VTFVFTTTVDFLVLFYYTTVRNCILFFVFEEK